MSGTKQDSVVVNAVEMTEEQAQALAAAHLKKAEWEANESEWEAQLRKAQLRLADVDIDLKLQEAGKWTWVRIALLGLAAIGVGASVYSNVSRGNAIRKASVEGKITTI